MLLSGVKHLSVEDKWTTHYDLSLELYSTLAELSIHLNKNDDALDAVKEIQQYAKTMEDKFRSQCVMLIHLTSGKDRNYQLGSQTAIDLLRDYGVKFPNKLYPGQMLIENTQFKRKLPGAKLSSMLDLPDMKDKRSLQIMKLLTEFCAMNIFLTHQDKNLGWYAMIRALSLSVDKGICEHTGLAVLGWAISLKDSGNYKEADEYAELALGIMDRFPYAVGSLHSRVKMIAAGAVFGVTRPYNKILDLWTDVHGLALRQGETEAASSAILGYTLMYIMIGLPLEALRTDLVSYELEARQFHLPETIAALFRVYRQTIINLQDDVSNPTMLKGEAIDEDEVLQSLNGQGHRMTKRDIYTYRLFLSLIFGNWEMVESLTDELEQYGSEDLSPSRGLFRRSLRGLAAFKIARMKGNKKHRATGRAILKEVEKDVKNGNGNAYSFYMMLQAEESPSKEKYDEAIRALARAGCVNFEAYMCERAGEYFLERDDAGWGEYYMGQALVLYEEWGARGKANRMKAEHSKLLESSDLQQRASTSLRGRTRYTSEHSDQLKSFQWDQVASALTIGDGASISISREGDTITDLSSDYVSEDKTMPGSILLP
jgi:predicted ATPase